MNIYSSLISVAGLASSVIELARNEYELWQNMIDNEKQSKVITYCSSTGLNRVCEYCAAFITWLLKENQLFDRTGLNSGTASAGAFARANYNGTGHYHQTNLIFSSELLYNLEPFYIPKPGDVVVYRWLSASSVSVKSHVGLVVEVSNNKIKTIEGNMGAKYSSIYNGEIKEYTRSIRDISIIGYFSW
jgi:hypothetical protein